MLIPLSHDRMTLQRLPWVTVGIIVVNLVVFLFTWPEARREYEQLDEFALDIEDYAYSHPSVLEEDCESCPETLELDRMIEEWKALQAEHIYSRYGYVPARPSLSGLLGSLFLHAGWMHLLGNMYFLWLCGCSIEDIWGRPLYAAVYLVGGAGAALTHAAIQPDSTAHLVGASGAIAALMGIFCVRCWNSSIEFFYMFLAFFGFFSAPAWIMLLLWFLRELGSAFIFSDSTVAFWAHIGGFAFGAAFAAGMKFTRLEEKFIAPSLDRKTNLVSKHPMFASGMEHFDRGEYREAVSALRIAVQEDREDTDPYHLLARSYLALGQPIEAGRWLRQELAIHLRRRDVELAASTYEEMVEAAPDLELTPRELFSLANVFVTLDHDSRARGFLETILQTASDPLLRLRSALSLAELYARSGDARKGLTLLDEAEALAAEQPEWQTLIEDKRRDIRSSMSLPAALSDL